MVDALREANRVLVAGGTLIDLRPLAEVSPLHLAESAPIGELDTTGLRADDESADAAIQRSVRSGWFVRVSEHRFSVDVCWGAAADFTCYVSRGRQPKRVRPGLAELLNVWRGPAVLRTRRTLVLGVYSKPGTGAAQRSGAHA